MKGLFVKLNKACDYVEFVGVREVKEYADANEAVRRAEAEDCSDYPCFVYGAWEAEDGETFSHGHDNESYQLYP